MRGLKRLKAYYFYQSTQKTCPCGPITLYRPDGFVTLGPGTGKTCRVAAAAAAGAGAGGISKFTFLGSWSHSSSAHRERSAL